MLSINLVMSIILLFGKELNKVEKIVVKGENACYQGFLFPTTFSKTVFVNSLLNDEILDWSKLKAFVHNIIKILKMMIFVFDRDKKIVRKGENAGYLHFLLFPQCF